MRQVLIRSLWSASIVAGVSLIISGGVIFAQNVQWTGPGSRTPGQDNVPPPILNAKTFTGVQSGASINVDGDIKAQGCVGPVFEKVSPSSYQGSAVEGYRLANALCGAGYHVCSAKEILSTIACKAQSPFGGVADNTRLWLSNGPPAFTANANDCNGWSEKGTDFYGAYWETNNTTGGAGYLTTCDKDYSFACCR